MKTVFIMIKITLPSLACFFLTSVLMAQPPASSSLSGREGAALDLIGHWVSIVNEDWRWRMVTPARGDFASLPLNARGRELGNAWNASQDGDCRAYGATGIMRMPLRLNIKWENDDVLRIETDAGQQVRRLMFNQARPNIIERSLQGYSAANWEYTLSEVSGLGFGASVEGNPSSGGTLKVLTTDMEPAWLRRNGAPSSESAIVTEYFDTFPAPDGNDWFVVTVIVSDAENLTQDYVTSSHFRREPDDSNWNPVPCNK